ncbi:MAG TPA: M4 family metallopeptidase, partial [Burkholderiaceae bacterium]|nr:M4 family metallopeptidase [Burkholderiaceae bacterium]HNG80890.1 M4 family metallopeptidase [Burkholderiaceae bacterium]
MNKNTSQTPLEIFYSYAHEDEKLRDALAKYLTPLKQQGIITEWHDRCIVAGEPWGSAIDSHLESAKIILLLVSVDFIASSYCWDKELARALERHNSGEARVIPIILRPVDWSGAPFASLQALPKDGKPVTLWPNKEVAWVDITKGIRMVADALHSGQSFKQDASSNSMLRPPVKKRSITKVPEKQQSHSIVNGNLRRNIFDAKNGTTLPGICVRQEGEPETGDAAVDEAYECLGACYRFFWNVYKRDSIDGKGMTLIACVHYGRNYNNAFWNGHQLISGDGDGKTFRRFTIALDVIGKEFSNGIVQSMSRLQYWHQTGALYSSIASVFACLIKQYKLNQTTDEADWLIGAGLFHSGVNGKALYSLANPGTAYDDRSIGIDPQPSHMRDYVETEDDNGGVHINAGIPNRAFYLIATAIGGYVSRPGRSFGRFLNKVG